MNIPASTTTKATDAVLWRLLQNFSTALVSFVLQILLARLLLPAHYGLIALTSVFITVSLVFIQTGFTSALIQKPTLTELEINSVHYASIMLAILLYLGMFASAPYFAHFYGEPTLSKVLRVQGLIIPIASLYSVPMSIIQRNLQLKITFIAGFFSALVQGGVGILLALRGYGVWALVYSALTNSLSNFLLIAILGKWRPRLEFSFDAVRTILPFSSRILATNLINTLFNNIKPLVVGRVYDSTLLGFYNRGYQIPSMIMTNVDGAINAVAFPVLSRYQNDRNALAQKLRKSLQISVYFVWPAMIGLVAVADPLVRILLTDKWSASVPFLQLTAFACMLWPFSVFLHATNAIGRSGLSLQLNIFAKGADLLVMAISYRYGIYAFIGSTLISSLVTTVITVIVVGRAIGFKPYEVLMDIAPTLLMAIAMGISVYCIGLLSLPITIKLLVQLCVGVGVYLVLTWVFKFYSLRFVVSYLKRKFL